jgi:hypothetical protein
MLSASIHKWCGRDLTITEMLFDSIAQALMQLTVSIRRR